MNPRYGMARYFCYQHDERAMLAHCAMCARPCCRDCTVEMVGDYFCETCKVTVTMQLQSDQIVPEAGRAAMMGVASVFVLGALLGRRSITGSRAASTARQVGRASTQRDDVQRAEKSIEVLGDQLAQIEAELGAKLERVRSEWAVDALEIEEVKLAPRKSEIGVELVALAWVPETGPAAEAR